MKTFNQFMVESTQALSTAAHSASKHAHKTNTIEAHEKAGEAHRKARYAIQDQHGSNEESMNHYHKENEHRDAAFELKKKKGAPPPSKEPNAKKFHWS